jgi:hypothetical protein
LLNAGAVGVGMNSLGTNFTALRVLTWTGPVLIGTLIVAMVSIGFIPPPSPADSAEAIARRFVEGHTTIPIACIIMMIAWTFWATYGVAITTMLRKTERGLPVLSYTGIALVGGGMVFFEMIPMTWAVAAYRPEALDPQIIRLINDWVWFNFLFTATPFALFFAVIGWAVLHDRSPGGVYPRWLGYANLWIALLVMPAELIVAFKTGPFAWNGLFAFWIPMALFVLWFGLMTVTTLRAITTEERTHAARPETALV